MLLEDNGVKSRIFLEYQRRAVADAKLCMYSAKELARTMEEYSLGSSYAAAAVIRLLDMYELFDLKELKTKTDMLPGFIRRLSLLTVSHVLRELKNHARIPVHGAWTLVGVADEWDELDEDEVYGMHLLTLFPGGNGPHLMLS